MTFLQIQCENNFHLSINNKISSSKSFTKRGAILTPVPKQWIAKDIPNYTSQLKHAKIPTHWFGKY